MRVAIMQPYLFAYIGYWQLINSAELFVIYDDVHYIKQGYINRNYILSNQGRLLITLQLIQASANKLINEISIGNNSKKLLKTIKQNYIKAPYFKEIYPIVEDILTQEEKNLAKFIGYSIKKLVDYLQIETKLIYSSDIQKDNNLKAQERIIDICKSLNATHYINMIGGKELYYKDRFKKDGLNLSFLTPQIVPYKQFDNEFVEYLSIIDVMMFNSVDKIQTMLNSYKLS